MAEEWRDIRDFVGLYQVSSFGRIRRITRFRKVGDGLFAPAEFSFVSRRISPKSGYEYVRLSNGSAKNWLVHRLVCTAFHGECPSPDCEVAHWDGVRHNNRTDNLRWATKIENAEDRRRHRRDALGEDHALSKLTTQDVLEIRRRHQGKYGDGMSLAREFGVTNTLITNITKRKAWKHV